MLCEMCGKDVPLTSRVQLEHSVLRLCSDCARFGTLLDSPAVSPTPTASVAGGFRPGLGVARATGPRRRLEERDLYQEIGEMELVPDWNMRIRIAREALQWTPEVLGKKLNEKKSVVLKIESGSFRPPDALVRKIEHQLKVRLRAEPEAPGQG
ncbi:MAG TPA: multiprotein-bridging factor 1 family protein [Thermoplasmata archaeon]|jgi:putative transcription factor|nr:multiprotein-bridging factor 1 family protein [Thermoplasmata archaeon]